MLERWILIFVLSCLSFPLFSQSVPVSTIDSLNKSNLNWYNLDRAKDSVEGVSVNKVYHLLIEDKQPKKIMTIAVIDSGFDFTHPDLKDRVWVNLDEIPGNGIDDDHNGYIDDIHGWNFLGNKEGQAVRYENYEEVRLFREYHPLFKDITNRKQLPDSLIEKYDTYIKCRTFYYKERSKYMDLRRKLNVFGRKYLNSIKILVDHYGKDSLNTSILKDIKTDKKSVNDAKIFVLNCYYNGMTWRKYKEARDLNDLALDKQLNLDLNPRKIIADNPKNINDTNYGNNDVMDLSFHGTFVSAIICANRNNNLGIDGIDDKVKIMALRAISKGDEYDKDVALAIRYAVDNGANIINMSFGKRISPQKKFVDEALKYAEDHNVLIVHGAGNEATDITKDIFYPTDRLDNGEVLKNFINVGATSSKSDEKFCGSFTNYSKKNVDIMAPGVDIISLYPNSRYYQGNGTSFSSPVVSGVAALIWSYFPKLKVDELKEILLRSCNTYAKLKVVKPDKKTKKPKLVKFKNLSKTGGVVNAYNAFLKAKEVYRKKGLSE